MAISVRAIPEQAEKFFLDGIQTYETGFQKIVGWALSFFGYTLRIYEGDKCFYIHRTALIHKLCQTEKFNLSSSAIEQLVIEILNPVIGEPIQLQQVKTLFDQCQTTALLFQLHQAQERSQAQHILQEHMERLKNRHLEVWTYDADALASRLQVGDIFFKKQPPSVSHIVVNGQKFIQPFIFGPQDREGYKYSHVAIYIGNGQIAEAVPNEGTSEVRIVSLDDPRFALPADSHKQYLIVRMKDATLAQEAAEIAQQVAQPASSISEKYQKETLFKYSKFQAIRSMWHNSNFGPFARYRYLKQYIDDHKQQLPRDFMDLKSFFCSYFVGYVYQTAESRRIMPALLGENDAPPKGITSFGTALFRGIWARVRRIQVWRQMSQTVQMQFDAKRLTPQDFRNFMVRRRDLFTDVALVH